MQMQNNFEKFNFTKVDCIGASTGHSPIMLFEKMPLSGLLSSIRYSIVVEEHSSYQRQLADIIKCQLDDTGASCEIHLLDDDLIIDGRLTAYIFLVELERAMLESISSDRFLKLQNLLTSAQGVLWLTSLDSSGLLPPNRAMIDGLSRVLRSENDQTVFVTCSLEMNSIEEQASQVLTLLRRIDFESSNQDYETAFVQVDGHMNISRLIPENDLSHQVYQKSLPFQSSTQKFNAGPPLKLAIESPGLLDSLHWVEDTRAYEVLSPDEVEIQVKAVGLNFKDVLIALGRVEGQSFGIECAGIIHRAGDATDFRPGDRVCVLTTDAFCTLTRVKADSVARIPSGISLSEAASIPVQFGTAYYTIQHMAKLQRDETILIHSAAGGTGQAAIQIAQGLGAEVFATVSSNEKKQFLMDRYHIPEDHIFYSRDKSFAQGILKATGERGVDCILNSLSGESLLASWEIIAPYGRFIELGKKEIDSNGHLPMRPFARGASFTAFEATATTWDHPTLVRDIISRLLELLTVGSIQLVEQLQVLPISEVQTSMRTLQEGKMIGKIVLEMTFDSLIPVSPSARKSQNLTLTVPRPS
jgi:NADPH:quinone reductase-like Zn-dependent oxidoreductase